MKPLRTTVALLIAMLTVLAVPALACAAPLSIKVEGNHFVDGEGKTIRLLGVDRTSSEYACVDGYAYDDGHYDDADAAAIASWDANAVRVPLNEDCWLGINGQPNSSQGAEPPLTAAGYRQEIESYVADLNAHGIYAILDLHWSAPGTQVALEQQPMPDKDHSPAFWTSVASAFKNDPAVVFDVFNEPFSPTDERSGDDPNLNDTVTWGCWRNGGCSTASYRDDGERTGTRYEVAGMQSLIGAIRQTGATQPIMVGGLNYADDLSGWLANRPTDPLSQLAASFHNYQGPGKCDAVSCWDSQIAPVAASVPVVTGEFAQSGCSASNFADEYMSWADAHGVGYLGWAWTVLTPAEMEAEGCDAYYLIKDWSGTPSDLNGTLIRSHLVALASGGAGGSSGGGSGSSGGQGGTSSGGGTGTSGPGSTGAGTSNPPAMTAVRLTHFSATIKGDGTTVSIQIVASASCSASISAQTVKVFKLGGHKAHRISLGATHASLNAGKKTALMMKLSASATSLLKSKGSLPARFTVTLHPAGGAPVVVNPTATLKAPAPKPKHHGH